MCHRSLCFQLFLRPDPLFPIWEFDYMRLHIPLLLHKLVGIWVSVAFRNEIQDRLTLKRILTYRNSLIMEQKSRKPCHTKERLKGKGMLNQSRRLGVVIFQYPKKLSTRYLCCVTNYPKMEWFKTITVYHLITQFLRVGNLGSAELGISGSGSFMKFHIKCWL